MQGKIHYTNQSGQENQLSPFQLFRFKKSLERKQHHTWNKEVPLLPIKSDCSKITFNNFDLGRISEIKAENPKTTCILDECSIIDKNGICEQIIFSSGNFIIIDPKAGPYTRFCLKDVTTGVLKFCEEEFYSVNIDGYIRAERVHIDSDCSIDELRINNVENVSITGTYYLRDFSVNRHKKPKKLTIYGTPENQTEITFYNLTNPNKEIIIISASDLELINCKIFNATEKCSLFIDADSISGENFTIKSKTNIHIGNYIVTDLTDEGYLEARAKDEEVDKYIIVDRSEGGFLTLTSKRYQLHTSKNKPRFKKKPKSSPISKKLSPIDEKIKTERQNLNTKKLEIQGEISSLRKQIEDLTKQQNNLIETSEQAISDLIQERVQTIKKIKIKRPPHLISYKVQSRKD